MDSLDHSLNLKHSLKLKLAEGKISYISKQIIYSLKPNEKASSIPSNEWLRHKASIIHNNFHKEL